MTRNGSEIAVRLKASADVLAAAGDVCQDEISRAADYLVACVREGGKIMACGNGGSAADAQHFAAELVGHLSKEVERPAIPALALTTDTSFLTAWSNDCDFSQTFTRQLEALGRDGDVVVLISTSGNSENVCGAAALAAERGIRSIGLLGSTGGRLASIVDCAIVVPSDNTQAIQECHAAIIHVVCTLVERELYGYRWHGRMPGSKRASGRSHVRTRTYKDV